MTGQYFIGIDGGGSKCRARLESDSGELLSEAEAGPANVARDLKQAIDSINQATSIAFERAGLPTQALSRTHAGMGLAGINVPTVRQAFETHSMPFASVCIATDLAIAQLGAHNGQDGAVVIIGTGSSAIIATENKHEILGGHGFLLGDQGSGSWIGKQAVTNALLELDGVSNPTHLASTVLTYFDCINKHALVARLLNASASDFASIAPHIIDLAEANHPTALYIVQQAGQYVDSLVLRILQSKPARLSLTGGLSARMLPFLSASTTAVLSPALLTPAQGAILLIKSTYLQMHAREI